MSSLKSSWFTRKSAFLSATAGVIFLLVGVFDKGWDWRGVLSFSAGVLWLIIAYQQFKKAQPDTLNK